MFVLLSFYIRTQTHRCSYCFLLFRWTLTIACVVFWCFVGLSPLLVFISTACCHCFLLFRRTLAIAFLVSSACCHSSYCFPCFFGLLPFFVLLSLFLRPVAIRQPFFVLLSLFLRHVAIRQPFFILLSLFLRPVAIQHVAILSITFCVFTACCHFSYCFLCFHGMLPLFVLLSVVFYGLSPLLVLLYFDFTLTLLWLSFEFPLLWVSFTLRFLYFEFPLLWVSFTLTLLYFDFTLLWLNGLSPLLCCFHFLTSFLTDRTDYVHYF